MDIDKMTIDELKEALKKCMVQMKKTIETHTHIYNEGEWYFYIVDDIEKTIFIYLNDPYTGMTLSFTEANKYLDF